MLLAIPVLKAQNERFTFGIKGGMDWTGLSGKDISKFSNGGNYESLSGQNIGISLNNKLSKYIYLKHELFYARRFLNIKMNDGGNPVFSSNIKRKYLDLFPANITYRIKGFQVYAGPYLGFLLSASIQRKDTLGNLFIDKSFYSESGTFNTHAQKMDAGFIAGIEYEFKIGLNIGVHYIRGFVPLIKSTTQHYQIFNQYAGITVGYSFIKTSDNKK